HSRAAPASPPLPLPDPLPLFPPLQMFLVEALEHVEHSSLRNRREPRVIGVRDDLLRIDAGIVDVCPLINSRQEAVAPQGRPDDGDRKSTRLNSSHVKSSYAVF